MLAEKDKEREQTMRNRMVNPNVATREFREVIIGTQQIPAGILRAIEEENKEGWQGRRSLWEGRKRSDRAPLANTTPNVAQMPLYQVQATQLHVPSYSLLPNSHRGYGALHGFGFLREKKDTKEWKGMKRVEYGTASHQISGGPTCCIPRALRFRDGIHHQHRNTENSLAGNENGVYDVIRAISV